MKTSHWTFYSSPLISENHIQMQIVFVWNYIEAKIC